MDHVQKLPAELRLACFGFLAVRDRVQASHVCRAWRDGIISEPLLWNKFSTNGRLDRSAPAPCEPLELEGHEKRLVVMLQRSKSLPFQLRWAQKAFCSTRCLQAVLDNLYRMTVLSIDHPVTTLPDALFEREAPILQSLDLNGAIFTLPKIWTTHPPPALRCLNVSCLILPPTVPTLRSLEVLAFDICVGNDEGNMVHLDAIFELAPALTSLKVASTEASSLPRRLPHGLRVLQLYACGAPVDYEPLLNSAPWSAVHTLRSLTLGSATGLHSFSRYFNDRQRGKPWGLDIDSSYNMSLSIPGELTLEALFHRPVTVTSPLQSGLDFQHLSSIQFGQSEFLADFVLAAIKNTLEFPALVTLALSARRFQIVDGVIAQWHQLVMSGQTFRVPHLREVIIYTAHHSFRKFVSAALKGLLRILLFEADIIQRVVLVTPDPDLLSAEHSQFFELFEYCRELFVENEETEVRHLVTRKEDASENAGA